MCHEIILHIGVEITMNIVCCDCEPLAVTLAHAQLWPASPSYTQYAFSFGFLDWAESLLLECQVALRDFCQAYNTMIVSIMCMHANECFIPFGVAARYIFLRF